ncbi:hypothetical protein EJ08DRAFT_671259 [Tothia fuscella]|uniref:VPS37 C-terminal domain-containing protein n=1 Tax=Tothia fuscella TaxID=1048955 RepID=A0A9P4NNN5_9PEZI|nr:hypothetical protein EJ08DRAFT_671259 [Tothia fuscella]
MAYHSPHPSQSQFQFNPSTPPPPPPKPSGHSSGHATPTTGPPRPPPPPGQSSQTAENRYSGVYNPDRATEYEARRIDGPEEGWLPEILKDKATVDLHAILSDPSLQQSLIHSQTTAHPSLPLSNNHLSTLLTTNLALATSLKTLESQIQHQRTATQSRLLSLRALERQWRAKQAEQDTALRDFSPPSLYQNFGAAIAEQEALCRGIEESFLEGEEGVRNEREVGEFLRKLREVKKVAYLRRERKERWDEGRVGGWR